MFAVSLNLLKSLHPVLGIKQAKQTKKIKSRTIVELFEASGDRLIVTQEG
jgi:hypothetical protein